MLPTDIEEKLHYIELFTRRKIRNPLLGNHLSLLKGHGYDFADHKKYQEGDDPRKIDWNATARMGYTLIKNTHEEKDVDVIVAADLSSSMEYASGEFSKKELLLYITASLAYSALEDHIRIGFLGFTDRVCLEIKPRKGRAHLRTLLEQIWDFEPPRHHRTDLLPALEVLGRQVRRMSLIFLVSDFLYGEGFLEEPLLKRLIQRNDVIPIVLSDPLENRLMEGTGYVRLKDLETGDEFCVRLSRAHRALYAEEVRAFRRRLIEGFYRFGLDYQEIRTNQSFYELLLSLFLLRKRR